MLIGMIGCHSPARRTLNKALLDQERFNDIFDGFTFFTNRRR